MVGEIPGDASEGLQQPTVSMCGHLSSVEQFHPKPSLCLKRGRWVGWVSHWTETLRVHLQVRGTWAGGSAARLVPLVRTKQGKVRGHWQVRGRLEQISGFITCCPKSLLAKGEVLTYLAAFQLRKNRLLTWIPLKASAGQTFFLSSPPLQWTQPKKCQVAGEAGERWVCKNISCQPD